MQKGWVGGLVGTDFLMYVNLSLFGVAHLEIRVPTHLFQETRVSAFSERTFRGKDHSSVTGEYKTKQVRLVSVKAERPNHPSHGVSASQGGSADQRGGVSQPGGWGWGSSTPMTTTTQT